MKQPRRQKGYTLIEVLASSVVIGMGLAAAVSLSSTVILQEEMAWRVSVALNYQENVSRVWQLGFDPNEVTGANGVMPMNPFMGQLMVASSNAVATVATESPYTDVLAGEMKQSSTTATVKNYTSAGTDGSTTVMRVYRPTIR